MSWKSGPPSLIPLVRADSSRNDLPSLLEGDANWVPRMRRRQNDPAGEGIGFDSMSQRCLDVKLYDDGMSFPRPNQRSGPLEGHVRKGRIYRPLLAATGVLHVADWVRDDLPDLLWPVLVLSELGTAEGLRFVRWQKAVQEDLAGSVAPRVLAECLSAVPESGWR